MNSKPFFAAAAAAASVLAMSSSALAQPAAAPAGGAIPGGPPVGGVCVINIEGAIGASTVGKYVGTRMQQLVGQVKAELSGEQTAIETENKTLEAGRGTMDQGTLEKRAADLQVRYNAYQRKAQLRDRELSATEQKALSRIGQEMDPVVRTVYQQKNCGLLLQSNAVVFANPAMDVTPQVIAGLNAKVTQFAFDREHLDQTEVATVPGATPPRPAAPATRK